MSPRASTTANLVKIRKLKEKANIFLTVKVNLHGNTLHSWLITTY